MYCLELLIAAYASRVNLHDQGDECRRECSGQAEGVGTSISAYSQNVIRDNVHTIVLRSCTRNGNVVTTHRLETPDLAVLDVQAHALCGPLTDVISAARIRSTRAHNFSELSSAPR